MLLQAEMAALPAWRKRQDSQRSAELVSVVEDYVRLLRSLNRSASEIDAAERRLVLLRKLRDDMQL